MGEQSLGRRQVLRRAGVVAAGGAAVTAVTGLGLATPAMASDGGDGGLTGSWMVTRQDDGDPTRIKAVFSFAGGGVFVEHDILPAGPPFTGTWARGDGGRFRATIWSGFPGEGPGSPGVAVRVRLVGRLEHRTISGTYTATVFDSTGAAVESNTGKFSGQPINA
jgi:hypothetical protein